MQAVLKMIVPLCMVIVLGSWQSSAMEQPQFDESSFIAALVEANSFEEFKAINQTSPVAEEDQFYCLLYLALRFGAEEAGSFLITIDEEHRIDALNDISCARRLEIVLRNGFYLACRYCPHYCETIATLLAKLVPLNMRDMHPHSNIRGSTLMHCAAQWSTGAVLEQLVSLGSYINAVDGEGRTPLHYAVIAESVSGVEFLCSQEKINPEIYDYYGYAPLHYSYTLQEEEIPLIVDALLKAGAKINEPVKTKKKTTLLHLAVEDQHLPLVKHLLGCDTINVNVANTSKQTPLDWALSIKERLENSHEQKREDINEVIEIIQLLVRHPSIAAEKPLLKNMTPLNIAVSINDEQGVVNLLSHPSVDVNMPGTLLSLAPLHRAITNIHILEALLTHPNIDPNKRNDEGNTPLHLAIDAAEGMQDCVGALLRHKKTEIYQANSNGLTPFDLAMVKYLEKPELRQDISEIVALLLRFGARPDFDHEGTRTTLKEMFSTNFFTIFMSQESCLTILNEMAKEDDSYIDQRDQYGTTLLMYVAARGDLEAVKFLLAKKADPLALDKYDNSALSLVKTILSQKRYELNITTEAELKNDIVLDIEDYEEIAARLQEAQIEAVITTDDVITLHYITQSRAKKQLDDKIADSDAKKAKGEEGVRELVTIPQEFNLFDTLPTLIIAHILNFNINYKS